MKKTCSAAINCPGGKRKQKPGENLDKANIKITQCEKDQGRVKSREKGGKQRTHHIAVKLHRRKRYIV